MIQNYIQLINKLEKDIDIYSLPDAHGSMKVSALYLVNLLSALISGTDIDTHDDEFFISIKTDANNKKIIIISHRE